MRFAWLLIPTLASAATLTISPPVIYDCTGTVGKATLEWSGASGPVYIGVGPAQVQMTGFAGSTGKAETGTWVGDGLEFRLVNQSGGVEAVAFARVRCNAGDLSGNGIVGASYFPLEVGNRWVYRVDSRAATSQYVTWQVVGLQRVGTHTYSDIALTTSAVMPSNPADQILQLFTVPHMLLREETDGTIWRFSGTPETPTETAYLRPSAARPTSFSNTLGSYPDAIQAVTTQSLERQETVFVRGVGLARSRSDLLTGSSGGFVSGMELVEFELATGPRVYGAIPSIAVAVESSRLDVTGRRVTNCAIPCYFVACGLTPGADPPGTYKPCVQTRIEAQGESDFWTELSLLNSAGEVVQRTAALPGSGESVRYVQLPLYSKPNEPLPIGTYRLVGRIGEAANETGTASMTIEIR